jgi:hypothetical protein
MEICLEIWVVCVSMNVEIHCHLKKLLLLLLLLLLSMLLLLLLLKKVVHNREEVGLVLQSYKPEKLVVAVELSDTKTEVCCTTAEEQME